MKENKWKRNKKTTRRTKSEQHKQDQGAGVLDKMLCIDAIRCFGRLRITEVPIRWKKNEKNRANGFWHLWKCPITKSVWWCTSLPGAQVGQWTGSWRGWVNEVSPQEEVSVHLWVPTLLCLSLTFGCPVKLEMWKWLDQMHPEIL